MNAINVMICVTTRFFVIFVFNYFMCVYLCLYVIICSWLYFLGFSVRRVFWSFWWARV